MVRNLQIREDRGEIQFERRHKKIGEKSELLGGARYGGDEK